MTLLTPGAVWPWPVDDAAVDLEPFVIVEWGKRGNSQKWLAYEEDAWNLLGRSATPVWLIKAAQDAIAERLTYLISRQIDLPCQHVFWGLLDNIPIAAIRFIPQACSMRRLHYRSDGSPYVIVQRHRINVLNQQDCIGYRALQTLFADFDGGECLIDPNYGLIIRVDGADGHSWASQGHVSLPEEDPGMLQELIQRLRKFDVSDELDWSTENVQDALRELVNQSRERLQTGPDVDGAIHSIQAASYIRDEDRPLMLHTLRMLGNCHGLPKRIADGFWNAPIASVRRMGDGVEQGLTSMCIALARSLPSE